jgi:hypothetical protein
MTIDPNSHEPFWRYETRKVNRQDGSIEIVRILNDDMLGHWSPNGPLAFEKSILWLQPIKELDFVRVGWVRNAQSRRGPLYVRGVGMMLGYAKLTTDAPRDSNTKSFTRRLFYLTEDDLQLNANQIPAGVYCPHSILPGVTGTAPAMKDIDRGYPAWIVRHDATPPVSAAS